MKLKTDREAKEEILKYIPEICNFLRTKKIKLTRGMIKKIKKGNIDKGNIFRNLIGI